MRQTSQHLHHIVKLGYREQNGWILREKRSLCKTTSHRANCELFLGVMSTQGLTLILRASSFLLDRTTTFVREEDVEGGKRKWQHARHGYCCPRHDKINNIRQCLKIRACAVEPSCRFLFSNNEPPRKHTHTLAQHQHPSTTIIAKHPHTHCHTSASFHIASCPCTLWWWFSLPIWWR